MGAATATAATSSSLLLAAAGCCWLPTHSDGPSHTHQVMRPAAKSDAPSGATPISAAGCCWLLLAAGCCRLVLLLRLLLLLLGCCWLLLAAGPHTHSDGPSLTHQVMRPAAKSDAPSGATPTSAAGGCWLLLAAGCGRLVLRLLLLRLLLGCWR